MVLLLLALGGALLCRPVRAAAHLVVLSAVNNPSCTFREGLAGILNRVQQWWARTRLEKACRLAVTDPEGRELWNTPQGDYWVPARNGHVLPLLLARQRRRSYGSVRPGSTVLDCGAHVGVYARSALAQGAALVVAIEPWPENVECLRRNLAAGISAGRVVLYPKGVWDAEGLLPIHAGPENSALASFVMGRRTARAVAVTTIDRLVSELRLARVDYIKMNIEGAEQRALAGARQTLAIHKPVLALAADHLPGDPGAIARLVRQARPDYQGFCSGVCLERQGRAIPEILRFE